MSMRPTEDPEYIRETQRKGSGGSNRSNAGTTKVIALSGGDGTSLPPAGTMSREFTEVFGYFIRRFIGFFIFPYTLGRRIGGRLK